MKRTTVIFIIAAILAAGVGGCGVKKKAEPTRAEIGQGMEREGVMSQADYVRLRAQIDGIRATGKISDGDLNWSLGLLKKSTSALAHTRVMDGLAILRQVSPSQKTNIIQALTPYLNSSSPLDRSGASRLQRTMNKL